MSNEKPTQRRERRRTHRAVRMAGLPQIVNYVRAEGLCCIAGADELFGGAIASRSARVPFVVR